MYPVSDSLSIAARKCVGNACRIRGGASNRIGDRFVVEANRGTHDRESCRRRTIQLRTLRNHVTFLRSQDVLRRNRLLGCRPKLRLGVIRHLPFGREKDSMRVLLVSTHVDQTTGYSKVA